ncbi:hypothetical protein HU200_005429 [Digitaria exilis]|uniref:ABC transmembrane type-1 domain-containing protein n=1 Tax=Digitaria exilis TaxID=1010633 RepID=A0A835KSP9_9POAL|nr:hypothetical protein HU200_005429 [Digitaria exilis]
MPQRRPPAASTGGRRAAADGRRVGLAVGGGGRVTQRSVLGVLRLRPAPAGGHAELTRWPLPGAASRVAGGVAAAAGGAGGGLGGVLLALALQARALGWPRLPRAGAGLVGGLLRALCVGIALRRLRRLIGDEATTVDYAHMVANFASVPALGFLGPLELADIPLLAHKDRAKSCYKAMSSHYERQRLEHPDREPVADMAILKSFWREAAVNGAFAAVNTIVSYVGPYLIRLLCGLPQWQTLLSPTKVTSFASIFFVAKLLETLTARQWYLGVDIMGIHVKSGLTAMVYRKGLRLSNASRQSHTMGEIVNYMAVDVQRVGDYAWHRAGRIGTACSLEEMRNVECRWLRWALYSQAAVTFRFLEQGVSLDRLSHFLQQEELPDDATINVPQTSTDKAVDIKDAADLILVLKDGHITQAGKYDDLLQAGTDFNALVSAHKEAIETMGYF